MLTANKAVEDEKKKNLNCSGKFVEDFIRAFVKSSKDQSGLLNSLTGLWVVSLIAPKGPDAALLNNRLILQL